MLFCAAGASFGVFLYTAIRFGSFEISQLLLPVLFFLLALPPFKKRGLLLFFLCFFLSASFAVLSIHLYTENYLSGAEGETHYEVTGTVRSFTLRGGYTELVLGDLTFDGNRAGGKLSVTLPGEEIRTGDVLSFSAGVSRKPLPSAGTGYSDFIEDIRYGAYANSYGRDGKSPDPFLNLNGTIFDVLGGSMGREEAQVGYALLTGNSGAVDAGVLSAVREGGIAHVFAVSGLHIGILYGAALLLFRPLKRYAFLPAVLLCTFYCAVSGFSVSSVRALVMCAALGVTKFAGRKYDLLHSLSLAALLLLLIEPADFLSAGFRLSFAAVAALALFSGTFFRGMRRIHIPAFAARTLSATLSVQLFTFPVLFELFGYVSLWGLLLNPVLVPLLPVLFLALFFCTVLSLILPFAAPFLLIFPEGLLSALLFLFAATDFSALLTGFSMGAGSVLLLAGGVVLSERVNFKKLARTGIAAGVLSLFGLLLVFENFPFGGCTVTVGNRLALIRTDRGAVLVMDGSRSLADCDRFLAKTYGGPLDGAVVLSRDGESVNTAAFLGDVYIACPTDAGLQNSPSSEDLFTLLGLTFRFEDETKLSVASETWVLEIDFSHEEALGADLFVGKDAAGLKFFLMGDIILAV